MLVGALLLTFLIPPLKMASALPSAAEQTGF